MKEGICSCSHRCLMFFPHWHLMHWEHGTQRVENVSLHHPAEVYAFWLIQPRTDAVVSAFSPLGTHLFKWVLPRLTVFIGFHWTVVKLAGSSNSLGYLLLSRAVEEKRHHCSSPAFPHKHGPCVIINKFIIQLCQWEEMSLLLVEYESSFCILFIPQILYCDFGPLTMTKSYTGIIKQLWASASLNECYVRKKMSMISFFKVSCEIINTVPHHVCYFNLNQRAKNTQRNTHMHFSVVRFITSFNVRETNGGA